LTILDIGLDDPAMRAGACDLCQIQPLFRRDAPRQRRGEDPVPGCRYRCCGGGSSRSRCRGWSSGLVGRRGRRGRGRRWCGADGRGVLALLEQHCDHFVDLYDALGAVGDHDLAERAFIDRLDLHGRLVGLDLGDDVAGGDGIALGLQPFGQFALFHGRGKRGHQDVDGHVFPP
jgi:hypothetical protein